MRWVKSGARSSMNQARRLRHRLTLNSHRLNPRQGGLTAANQTWQGDRAGEPDWFDRWPTDAARARCACPDRHVPGRRPRYWWRSDRPGAGRTGSRTTCRSASPAPSMSRPPKASALRGSRHILEEDVTTELKRLLRSHNPSRRPRHSGRVVVRGPSSGIRHFS